MKKKKKIPFIKTLEIIIVTVLVISFAIMIYCIYLSAVGDKIFAKDDNNMYDAQKTATNAIAEEVNISEVIEEINHSVVGISKVKNKGNTVFLEDGVESLGLGTGFIVTEDGYIVTNEHVSGSKYSTCYVTLEDGRNYTANVVWSDSDIDLSIVKINLSGLKALTLGNSDNIKIAQEVYAIGNPIGFEFQRTVTSGIISALDRTIKIEEETTTYMEDLIQTDAGINPGNSGGPLIDKNGKVIGINSVKITSAEGIGFAIPIDYVKPILEKIVKSGEVNSATLGIFAYDKNVIPYINQELNKNYTLENGIYVAYVNTNSPAGKAGIKEGDILLKIDNIELTKMSDLRIYIYSKNPSDEVTLTYKRNNRTQEITVKLGKKI